jgi:outer membrane autotransporter protein
MILKTLAAAALAVPLVATGAQASEADAAYGVAEGNFYANIENNVGWTAGDYDGALTEFHVGYGFDLNEKASLYIQGGPALVNVDGEGTETEFSAYIGGEAQLAEKLDLYGEVGYLTGDLDSVTTEVGVTYTF